MKLRLLNYEINSREEQMFLESLDEAEEWHELQEGFKEKSYEAMRNFAESPESDSKYVILYISS